MSSDEGQTRTEFDDLEADEQDSADGLQPGEIAAVVSGTDWTTETIVSQLSRGNIELNPRFQRRDAWQPVRKSRLVESLVVGLPIPQIVLAESKESRGKFIVLDGKQRLLAILQFWGHATGPNNSFALSGLTLRKDLNGRRLDDLKSESSLEADYTALCNQSVRTVVIKNWKDTGFLHTVFLRLNTGSVALSPQELRQALLPGPFSDYVDQASGESEALRRLLRLDEPDPRMRDVEILARYVAFHFYANKYPGRMKGFLDETFSQLNENWKKLEAAIHGAVEEFEAGLESLLDVFQRQLARKPGSSQFNRAIFDALIFYHARPEVRAALQARDDELRAAYEGLFAPGGSFSEAIESDTASPHNTDTRLRVWAQELSGLTGSVVDPPEIPIPPSTKKRARATKKKGAAERAVPKGDRR